MFSEEKNGKKSYDFIKFNSAEDAFYSLQNSETSAVIFPVNVAQKLYDFSGGNLVCACVTQNFDFFCVTSDLSSRSLSDLLGKNVVLSEGGLLESFTKWILQENSLPVGRGRGGISLNFEKNETLATSKLLSSSYNCAFLSEPAVSEVLKRKKYHMAVDFQDEYEAIRGRKIRLSKNVLLVRKQFYEENKDDYEMLLNSLHDSIQKINENPTEAAFLCRKNNIGTDYSVLSNSIKNASFSFEKAEDAKEKIIEVMKIYNEMNKENVSIPDDNFFATY